MAGLAYSFRDSVLYHDGREHGGMHADMVLATPSSEGNRKLTETRGVILSIGNLRVHSDTLPPTRYGPTPPKPPFLIVPLPTRLWGPITLRLLHNPLLQLGDKSV